jgi:hypothetical protein
MFYGSAIGQQQRRSSQERKVIGAERRRASKVQALCAKGLYPALGEGVGLPWVWSSRWAALLDTSLPSL